MELGTVVTIVIMCAGAIVVPLVKFWLTGRASSTRDLDGNDPSGHQASAMYFGGNESGGGWSDGGGSTGGDGGGGGGDGGGGSW